MHSHMNVKLASICRQVLSSHVVTNIQKWQRFIKYSICGNPALDCDMFVTLTFRVRVQVEQWILGCNYALFIGEWLFITEHWFVSDSRAECHRSLRHIFPESRISNKSIGCCTIVIRTNSMLCLLRIYLTINLYMFREDLLLIIRMY